MPTQQIQLSERMKVRLEKAAELRAQGNSWNAVAELLHCSHETCRRWPRLYPDAWRTIYFEAESGIVRTVAAEGVAILRTLTRSTNDWIRLWAAKQLAGLLLGERKLDRQERAAIAASEYADLDLPLANYVRELQNLSEEEVERRFTESVERFLQNKNRGAHEAAAAHDLAYEGIALHRPS